MCRDILLWHCIKTNSTIHSAYFTIRIQVSFPVRNAVRPCSHLSTVLYAFMMRCLIHCLPTSCLIFCSMVNDKTCHLYATIIYHRCWHILYAEVIVDSLPWWMCVTSGHMVWAERYQDATDRRHVTVIWCCKWPGSVVLCLCVRLQ